VCIKVHTFASAGGVLHKIVDRPRLRCVLVDPHERDQLSHSLGLVHPCRLARTANKPSLSCLVRSREHKSTVYVLRPPRRSTSTFFFSCSPGALGELGAIVTSRCTFGLDLLHLIVVIVVAILVLFAAVASTLAVGSLMQAHAGALCCILTVRRAR